MRRILRALMVGLVTGAAGLLALFVPSVSALEDTLGLRWLFLVRGPTTPQPSVAVISIDEVTPVRLGLPERVRDWPRSVHGRLVEKLVQRGVSAIAFDLEFFRH